MWSDELMPRLLKRPMLLLTSGKIIGRVPSEDVAHGTHLDRHQHRRRDLTRRQVGERHQLHRLKAVVLESSSGGRRRRWAQAAVGAGGDGLGPWRGELAVRTRRRRQHAPVLAFRISEGASAACTCIDVQDLASAACICVDVRHGSGSQTVRSSDSWDARCVSEQLYPAVERKVRKSGWGAEYFSMSCPCLCQGSCLDIFAITYYLGSNPYITPFPRREIRMAGP